MAEKKYLSWEGVKVLVDKIRALIPDTSKFSSQFNGTSTEWNALSDDEKDAYDSAAVDDMAGAGSMLTGVVEEGNENAVTSDAVATSVDVVHHASAGNKSDLAMIEMLVAKGIPGTWAGSYYSTTQGSWCDYVATFASITEGSIFGTFTVTTYTGRVVVYTKTATDTAWNNVTRITSLHGEGTTTVGYTTYGKINLRAGHTMFLAFRSGVDNIVLYPPSGSEITLSGSDHIFHMYVSVDGTYTVKGYSNTAGTSSSVDLVAIREA